MLNEYLLSPEQYEMLMAAAAVYHSYLEDRGRQADAQRVTDMTRDIRELNGSAGLHP